MPRIPKHIPIQMLFIVCNFKMPHPIHDILFLVHTVHLQLEILYAFPTPPTTSSPSPFRGCTFRSFVEGCKDAKFNRTEDDISRARIYRTKYTIHPIDRSSWRWRYNQSQLSNVLAEPIASCILAIRSFSAIQICIPNPPKIAYGHQISIPFLPLHMTLQLALRTLTLQQPMYEGFRM